MFDETRCPECGRMYTPELGRRRHLELLVQEEFPLATPVQREQLVTGLCSQACWDKWHQED